MRNQTQIRIGTANRETSAATRGHLGKSVLAGAIALALVGAQFANPANAASTQAGAPPSSAAATAGPVGFADIAERVTPAVVDVSVRGRGLRAQIGTSNLPEGLPFEGFMKRFFEDRGFAPHGLEGPGSARELGSGFIVDPTGLIVTNFHVVDGADEIQVTLSDGSKYDAQVKGLDPKTDLALLKIDAEKSLPFVRFGDSDAVRVGDWVLTVGNPFGLPGSVTAGIISARGRDIRSGPYDDYFQIDAPINRGNSGGPLFDTSGRVVGVNTAIYSPSGGNVGVGFAIPAATASGIVAQLRENGHVARGWLGVQIQPVTDDIAEGLGLGSDRGALVASVVPDSPAAKAGLRSGDVILHAGDKAIESTRGLSRLVASIPAGTDLSIEVWRNGAKERLPVVIGPMPAEDEVAAAADEDVHGSSPRLGLRLAPMTPEARDAMGVEAPSQGVIVAGVEKGSPADQAGIKAGNVISMVGQRKVVSPEELIDAVQEAVAQHRHSVALRVEQDGKARFVGIRLAA